MRRVDPRLLAVLRVLYSDSEEQLLGHGYDPFLLQQPGSMLSADREAHVVRTLIGIVAVILNGYGTDIERDLHLLHSHDDSSSSSRSSSSSSSHSDSGFTTQSTSVDTLMVKNDCLRQLRNIFSLPHINTLSPTIRKLSMATATADPASSSSSLPHRPHPAEDELSGFLRKSTRSKYRDIDLTTAGDHLPQNTRQAYLYRIRKKQLLIGMIEELADYHRMLQQQSSGVPDLMSILSAASPLDGRRVDGDKLSRTAHIRELLEEVGRWVSR